MSAVRPVVVTSLAAANRSGQPTRERFLRFFDHILLITWPLLGIMAILAKPLIIVAFGKQWIAATQASRIVCLAGAFWVVGDLAIMTLIAMGAVRRNLVSNAIVTPIQLVLIVVGCRFGIEGVAVALTLSAVLLGLMTQWKCSQLLDVPAWRLGLVVARGTGCVIITSIIPWAVVMTRTDTDMRPGAAENGPRYSGRYRS
jgi:O-antigen/teichoic acid export membrane protein